MSQFLSSVQSVLIECSSVHIDFNRGDYGYETRQLRSLLYDFVCYFCGALKIQIIIVYNWLRKYNQQKRFDYIIHV